MSVLGNAYTDIYLAQKDRPESMVYFDFVMSEVHGLRIKELLDEKEARNFVKSIPRKMILDMDADKIQFPRENLVGGFNQGVKMFNTMMIPERPGTAAMTITQIQCLPCRGI